MQYADEMCIRDRYKYLTLYVIGKLTYEEMFTQLETAIHQFAKRQMTWFRRMRCV